VRCRKPAFLLTDLRMFRDEYKLRVRGSDIWRLRSGSDEDLLGSSIVAVPECPEKNCGEDECEGKIGMNTPIYVMPRAGNPRHVRVHHPHVYPAASP
jgi:hypothetical protein